jgi:DNA processing protein
VAIGHHLQLALTEGLGPILIQRLIASAGSAEATCAAPASWLQNIEGIGPDKSRKIAAALKEAAQQTPRELERAAAAGVGLVCLDDKNYPTALRDIPDPPPVIYFKGTLEDRDLHALAIVGSRRCSHYGREQAERFAALAAGAGLTIVSGGARGVDSAAHRGALSANEGRTIAVLGCGVDVAYPPENKGLFDLIVARGALVSEFPLETPPLKENFPRRNRIISGMSRGVLVIEADTRSGALITARQACDDHGRPVFAVPGRVDNPMSAGPHALIRDGAILAENLQDILDGLGPLPDRASQPDLFDAAVSPPETAPPTPGLSDRQQAIVASLDDEPMDVDGIIARVDLPAEIILQELTTLTLRGAIRRVAGQNFIRRK